MKSVRFGRISSCIAAKVRRRAQADHVAHVAQVVRRSRRRCRTAWRRRRPGDQHRADQRGAARISMLASSRDTPRRRMSW